MKYYTIILIFFLTVIALTACISLTGCDSRGGESEQSMSSSEIYDNSL